MNSSQGSSLGCGYPGFSVRKNGEKIIWSCRSFSYHGTIKSNIAMYQNLSDDQVQTAATLVVGFLYSRTSSWLTPCVWAWFEFFYWSAPALPFARTVASQPKIRFWMTTQLDSETESMVQATLAKMRQGRITIAVPTAFRLSKTPTVSTYWTRGASSSGTHEELLALEDLSCKMYSLQAGAMS